MLSTCPPNHLLIREIWITCLHLIKNAKAHHWNAEFTRQVCLWSWLRMQVTKQMRIFCIFSISYGAYVNSYRLYSRNRGPAKRRGYFSSGTGQPLSADWTNDVSLLNYLETNIFCPPQLLEDVDGRLVILSDKISLCDKVLEDLKALSDLVVSSLSPPQIRVIFLQIWLNIHLVIYVLQGKSFQGVSLPQQKWPEVEQTF